MDKEERESMKAYRKMQSDFTKRLVQCAKEFRPFDWTFMTEMIDIMLENFETYYFEGNNINQTDSGRLMILEQIGEVRRLFNLFIENNFYEEAYEFANAHLLKSEFDGFLQTEWDSEENAEICNEMFAEACRKSDETRTQAFEKFGEYIQYWWD